MRGTFKPEFINRLDEIVQFHQLTREEISRIVEFQVAKLAERVRERGIEIELTDDARTLLGNLGYDPTYGARPLRRVIQKQLVDKLALALLEGDFQAGDRGDGRRRRRPARVQPGGVSPSGCLSTHRCAVGADLGPVRTHLRGVEAHCEDRVRALRLRLLDHALGPPA